LVHTAYDVIKLQYYKTFVYITLLQQHWNWNAPVITSWLFYLWKFWVNANNKRSQITNYSNCLKCCPFALTHGLESFRPLVNGPVNDGQFEVSPDLNQYCFSSARSCVTVVVLYACSCMVQLLPWKPRMWHLIHIKLYKRNQSAI